MGNKALKIFYAVFMAVILVSLVIFMIIHIQSGLETQNAKMLLGGYVILLLWAGFRLFTLLKELLR